MSSNVKTTLIFGFISAACSLIFISIPVSSLDWSIALKLYAWGNLVLYSILLCRWSEKTLIKVFFPIILLLGIAVFPLNCGSYFIITSTVLSWIRSGICFIERPARSILVEITLCVGFVVVLTAIISDATYGLPIAIWLFYLLQALYFYLVHDANYICVARLSKESFAHAFNEMERIFEGDGNR